MPDDDRGPALRARWTQVLLDALERLERSQRFRVIEKIGATRVAHIDELDATAWVRAEDHIAVLGALHDVLDPPEFVAYVRQAGVASMRSPFLRTVAVAGVKVFGRSALLRVLPRAWRISLRACGRLRVERDADAGETTLVVSELPEVLRNEVWRLALAATLASSLDLGGYIGRVQVDDGIREGDTLTYRVSLVVEPDHDPSEGHCGGVSGTET